MVVQPVVGLGQADLDDFESMIAHTENEPHALKVTSSLAKNVDIHMVLDQLRIIRNRLEAHHVVIMRDGTRRAVVVFRETFNDGKRKEEARHA